MADIAIVFHWPPETFDRMSVTELVGWHDKALIRWKRINRSQ
ncbi:MAG: GpE family phage tail protein [Xanthomonadales bacterium]|nr:GpE family phage tail protein [Xanthomonadales bacterium]